MPDITTNQNNDFVANLKRVTKEIISKDTKQTSRTFFEAPSDEIMKENLLYFLLGFDTENISFNGEEIEINPLYKNKHNIYPFKELALHVKATKKFIKQMQFANDFCKQTFSEYLSERVQLFQLKAVENSECDIEILYINLHSFADEFKEYDYMIKEFDGIYGLDMYNYFFAKDLMTGSGRLKQVVKVLYDELEKKIWDWCINSQVSADFFIIENTNQLAFDECFWKDRYKIAQTIPMKYVRQVKKILSIGLMQKTMKTTSHERITESELPINIISFYIKTHELFQRSILTKLKKEIMLVHKTYFITNYSALLLFYDNNMDKIFTPYEMVNIKTDQYNFDFQIKLADTRINHFILKVLNVERQVTDVRRNIFKNLSIVYKPELFSFFFSEKTYFELELIFRFLLQIYNFEYVLVSREKDCFTTLVLSFLTYFKSVIYTNIINRLVLPDTIEMVSKFEQHIKSCLKKFYFTNESIFKILADIFDVIFEYVYCKTNPAIMQKNTLVYLTLLRDELMKQSDDYGLLFYVCRLIQ